MPKIIEKTSAIFSKFMGLIALLNNFQNSLRTVGYTLLTHTLRVCISKIKYQSYNTDWNYELRITLTYPQSASSLSNSFFP